MSSPATLNHFIGTFSKLLDLNRKSTRDFAFCKNGLVGSPNRGPECSYRLSWLDTIFLRDSDSSPESGTMPYTSDHGPWDATCPVCGYPVWTLTGEKHDLLFSRLAEHIASTHPDYYSKKRRTYPELYSAGKVWVTLTFVYFALGLLIVMNYFVTAFKRGEPNAPPIYPDRTASPWFIPSVVAYLALGGLLIFLTWTRLKVVEKKWKESHVKPPSADDLVTSGQDQNLTGAKQ
jgi:hypothetical protein